MARNPSSTERQRRFMCAEYGRKKAGKKTTTGMTKAQLREFCKKPLKGSREPIGRRKHNPHLTSGKWRFVGMFQKGDVGAVKRILQIHGIAHKVTADHTKHKQPGYKELYVQRETWQTAYAAITRLYEGGIAA